MLTTFDLDDYVFEALRTGCSGFLLKDAPAEELIRAVHLAVSGEALLAPSVTKRLIADAVAQHPGRRSSGGSAGAEARALESLTPREREILEQIATGRSNRSRATS